MPSPPDAATAERMRRALQQAESALLVGVEGDTEAWSADGRSLGRPALGDQWLRVATMPAQTADAASWDGAEAAENAIAASVPRPRLHGAHNWSEDDFVYRAELYDRIHERPLSETALPPADLRLPAAWWTSLRTALAEVAATPTERVAIRQQHLDRSMPTFLETDLDTWAPEWSTAHAALRWPHLTAPTLFLLDWHHWGLAPTGYDEASLYISALATPQVADQVHQTFGPTLDSRPGRFAQLVVASEFLQRMRNGENLELRAPLRRQVAYLLGERGRPE